MFRFATFAAVSSSPQAREDKASLGDQVKTARASGLQQGGIETAGPFILDGYSRTGYVNLSDAIENIPPLAAAIEAAEQNKYDVLIMDNIERMGDLAPMLSTLFKKYKKQLHSARQSGRVFDPADYDPYNDESSDIMIHVEGIIQKYRINKLRRGWNIGIPRRLEKGLPPFRIAYGYTRVDKNTPPVKNEYAVHVIQIKDWFLAGRPRAWIARQLTEAGIPKPSKTPGPWHVASIQHILLNPFYAGIVATGQKRAGASKTGRTYLQRTPHSEWQRGTGGHEPLWDESTLLAIENEFARRAGVKNYAKVRYPLAGLMRCTVCRQKLTRRNITRGGKLQPGLGCCKGEAHVILGYDQAIRLLTRKFHKELQERQLNPASKSDEMQRLQAELADYKARRAQVHKDYEDGIYKREEAIPRIKDLERLEQNAQHDLDELGHTQQTRAEMRELTAGLAKYTEEEIYLWIAEDESSSVNRLLSTLCETLWVTPEHEIEFEWRP